MILSLLFNYKNNKNYTLFSALIRFSDCSLIIVMTLCGIQSGLYYFYAIFTIQFIFYFNIEVNKDDLSISFATPFMALFVMFFGIQITTELLGLKIQIMKAILEAMKVMN